MLKRWLLRIIPATVLRIAAAVLRGSAWLLKFSGSVVNGLSIWLDALAEALYPQYVMLPNGTPTESLSKFCARGQQNGPFDLK